MTKKKKRVFTKSVSKDVSARAVGFIGQRWAIRGGAACPIQVSVIGGVAFEKLNGKRGGNLDRARVIPLASLFPTAKAALAALKPKLAFSVRYGEFKKIQLATSPTNGEQIPYNMEGARLLIPSQSIFTDKRRALRALLNHASKKLTEAKKEHQKALRNFTRTKSDLEVLK